ncbi:MAG: DUF4369 domain-containing protein [Bacteroidales bacterium]|nr:DUF4369 domain-containing protein [Bacteroidales bacterium]
MKHARILLILACAACLLAGCSRTQKFTVASDPASARIPEAQAVLVISEGLAQPIEAPVTDGSFTLQGEVKKPAFAYLLPKNGTRKDYRGFILEKGAISFQEGHATGTPLNDAVNAFVLRLRDVRAQYSTPGAEMTKAIEQEYLSFVTEHKNDPCAIYAILQSNRRISEDAQRKLIEAVSPEIRNNGEIRLAANRLKSGARNE